jgi:hypothetical protein
MRVTRFIRIVGTLLALGISTQLASAQVTLEICCDGSESDGGSPRRYDYYVQRSDQGRFTITRFVVQTMDPDPANYTFYSPHEDSMTVRIEVDPYYLHKMNPFKTPHGGPGSCVCVDARAAIVWEGSYTPWSPTWWARFGFEHGVAGCDSSWNAEWYASAHPVYMSSSCDAPISGGPEYIYTHGYVHAPSGPPGGGASAVEDSAWGGIKSLYR